VTAADVTIDGFTINGDFGVFVQAPGAVVANNIVTGTARALSLDFAGDGASVLDNDIISNSRSLHVSAGNKTNVEINRNRFSGPLAGTGIFFSGNFSIDGFDFNDNEVLHLANIAANISNGTVNGNTFDAAAAGTLNIQISLHDSVMTDNIFEGDGVNRCLQIFGSQFGLVPSSNVTISDNAFNDCNDPNPLVLAYGIQLSPDISNIFITNNTFLNSEDGVNTRDLTAWVVSGTIHINNNNITGSTNFGVRNGQTGVLDAECNWWGSATGPMHPSNPTGTGDKVSNNVDFTPWLIAPAPGGPCRGGLPSGKVTGGGQINVPGGRGSFGFNAKQEGTVPVTSGHLTYQNHATGARLNCTVDTITVLTATMAKFSGTCNSKSSAPSFSAEVEDNGEPGKNVDKFTITYGPTEGGLLRAGNIQIHNEPSSSPQTTGGGVTGAGAAAFPGGATFNGISLSGLEIGTGVSIASDGAATGRFLAVLLGTSLLGQPREIAVDGKVSGGSIGPDGSVTFGGTATVDFGDGSLPALGVPFTVTATTGSLLLTLGTSTLPSTTLNTGSITID
jgi:hypothetical protein